MSERDSILTRIREALSVAAPQPGAAAHAPKPAPRSLSEVLPRTGANFEQNVELFRQNSVELKADFILVPNADELAAKLKQLRDAEGWKRIASHAGSMTDAACRTLSLPTLLTDSPHDVHELEACDAGLTECDALVAQTGSVLVTSRSAGGRALSVLPPHHVVLARRDQLVPGLPDAFALLQTRYGASYPSMISFITGPSRTGDIERILVLGAHGPKKLTIFCI